MKNQVLEHVKDFIRRPYAWPGSYAKVLIMNDGECLCHNCCRENYKLIVRATLEHARDGWEAVGCDVNWESHDLYCAHCGVNLAPEYSDD